MAVKIKKNETAPKRQKINVSIYENELDTVKQVIGAEFETTPKGIRRFFGLKPSAKTTGLTTQIKEKLKTLTPEQKQKLLEQISQE